MTLAGLHREFLRHCEAEKRLAPQTIIAYRSDFAQFLTYLLEGRPGRGRPDSLRAFTTAGLRGYQRHMAILALLAFAGLRRSEVMTASVGDYSRGSRSLRVRGKGSKDRVVPLHVTAMAALDTYLASRGSLGPRDPLLASWRGRIGKRPIINAVARAGRRLGIRLHPHLFRHTFATELLNRRADLRVIQTLLGHESLETTEIYTHVSSARRREAVDLLSGDASAFLFPPGRGPG